MQALHAHRKSILADPAAVSAVLSKRLRFASDAILPAMVAAAAERGAPACFSDTTGDALKMAHLNLLYKIFDGNTSSGPGPGKASFTYVAMGYSPFGAAEYLAWKHGAAAIGTVCTVPVPGERVLSPAANAVASACSSTEKASGGHRDGSLGWDRRPAEATPTTLRNATAQDAVAALEGLVTTAGRNPPLQPRICSRTLMGYSDPISVLSGRQPAAFYLC